MLQFVHSSDWHLPTALPPKAEARQLKQLLSRLSWRLARHQRHRRDVFDAAVRAWERQRADRLCVTGDLVNFAHPAEFAAATLQLERLAKVSRISLVPGNHDALVANGLAEQERHWVRWLTTDDTTAEAQAAGWPKVQIHGSAVFIGLSSAIPTGPFLAQGRVAPAQLSALERVLSRFRKSGHFRVVMVHHPLQIDAAPWRRRLRNAQALREVLGRSGAELVLHGHLHRRIRGSIESADGPIPVFGAGSSSLASGVGHGARAHFHRFVLGEPRNGRWSLEVTDYFHDGVNGEFCPGLSSNSFLDSPGATSPIEHRVFARVDLVAPGSVPLLPR